jgi:hypothetical protein
VLNIRGVIPNKFLTYYKKLDYCKSMDGIAVRSLSRKKISNFPVCSKFIVFKIRLTNFYVARHLLAEFL